MPFLYNHKPRSGYVMAVSSTTIGFTADILDVHVCDKQLHDIIDEINHYLYNFGRNWFFLSLGRAHYQKCCRSWVRVYTHLDKFLRDPRSNYSLLMVVIEHEKHKFQQSSYYAKRLKELEQLVSMGPNFSITSAH